jgi:4-amino-4-deoxy-L-arabinose transferase-like glycosyltransferase
VAAALALLLLLPGLGAAPLDDPGEGQHAEIAREAAATGSWLTLHLNGVPYLDKPPLLYLLVAGAFRLGGETEWAARLPAAAGASAAVAGVTLLGARLLGPAAGLLAGGALLSCALFAAFGRYVRPETLFLAGIQWGMAGLLLGEAARRPRAWALAGGVALGLAALTKDPLGLVGPLAALAVAHGLAGRLRPWRRWLPPVSLAALVVVGLGWYALAAAASRGFLWYVVVDNHLLNALQLRRFPDEDVPLGTLEFLLTTGLGAFPWVGPAALAAVALARRRAWRDPVETPWIALGVWTVAVIGLFALLPFKLPHHGLPAYPAIALLAARWWAERPPGSRGAALAHLAVFGALALGAAWLWAGDGRAVMETVLGATDITARKAAAAALPAAAPSWDRLRPLFGVAAGVLGAGAMALVLAAALRAPRLAAAVTLLVGLGTVPLVTSSLAAVAEARSVRGVALELRARLGPDDVLVHEGPIEHSGALELYSGRRPVLLDATRSVLGFGATLPGTTEAFWTAARLRAEWSGARRLWLLTPRPPARSVTGTLPAGAVRLVTVQGGRWLDSNRPAP